MSLGHALVLLAQVGPSPTPLNLPTGLEDRPRPAAPAAVPAPARAAAKTPLSECLDAVKLDPPAAAAMAEDWSERAKGPEAAQAQFCLGSAKAALGNWDNAETAFAAGRDAAAPGDKRLRAQLGAMAGTAALMLNAPDRALALLDQAHGDAQSVPDARLAGDISVDRSRALVALKREGDAATALAEARTANPENGEAWLLSATLARRQGKLDEAQGWIEQAAALAPRDPQVGLEAGVIAVLGGRDEAARKSWQSVIAAAPDSDEAKAAKGYLDQLAIEPAPAPPAASAQ
jgi:tetratricopeptide (TPR) repeat protein